MNILVTGAAGQLGNCMRRAASGSSDNYIFTDVAELDITDAEAVARMVGEHDIRLIVNCAAYTNVDRAEDDAEAAERLNAVAVANLAAALKANDGTLIHISTDYVFGGALGNTPRTEEEPVNPTGVYGRSKLRGERAIADSGVKALIFRTAWLYSEYGRNFVRTMLDLTASRPELNVVFDQVGTPTYACDLAEAIVRIVGERMFEGNEGIYHYSDEGVCSWFDFTKRIAEYAGNTACDIRPCHSDEFPSKVVRPSFSVLDKTKFKKTFGLRVPYWTDSLKTCIENLQKHEA
ncbi:MAG: dTDP-4-dehydrorhamnose reductase [Alistipes sp.]|nr:dTDP-4-dehydrorhamnose reductase [Alistipes sp.]